MNQIHAVNLNLLIVLETILRLGSVTGAASELHLSQSAVSHALRKLRVLFKDALFIQQGHKLEPTSLALDLYPRVQRLVGDVRELIFEPLHFDAQRSEREFHVAALDFVDMMLVPKIYRLMSEQSPLCRLQVHRPSRNDINFTLEENPSYAALGIAAKPVPEILEKTLWKERFASATSIHHPLANKDSISLNDFCRFNHALISTGNTAKSLVDEVLEGLGKSRRTAVVVPSFLSIPLLVSESDLIVTAPLQCLRMLAVHLPLKLYEPPVALPGFTMKLFWHRRYDRDPAQIFFRQLILTAAKELKSL